MPAPSATPPSREASTSAPRDTRGSCRSSSITRPSSTSLHDILSDDPYRSDDAYGFRCENSFITVRPPGWSTAERSDNGMPHVVRPPQRANAMRYHDVIMGMPAKRRSLFRGVWQLGGNTAYSAENRAL